MAAEASLARPPLTSCCVAQFLTAHGVVQVFGPLVGIHDLESLKLLRRTIGIFVLLLGGKASDYSLFKKNDPFKFFLIEG